MLQVPNTGKHLFLFSFFTQTLIERVSFLVSVLVSKRTKEKALIVRLNMSQSSYHYKTLHDNSFQSKL